MVGGGISGLVAARQVARSGRRVLLVEARDRVGGRVLNHHLARRRDASSPAAPSSAPPRPTSPALARELGVPTFLEYNTGNSVYISSTTGRMEYAGTVPPDPTILPDAARPAAAIDSTPPRSPVDAPWTHPRAAEWDAMTLGEYIRRNAVNADGVENLIRCWTQPGFGADPGELSFLYVLWYVACSGNEKNVGTFSRNSDTANGAQERRFVGGSQLIPLRLAKQLGDIVALRRAGAPDRAAATTPRSSTPAAARCAPAGDRRRSAAAGARHRLVPAAAGPPLAAARATSTWAS